MVEGLVLAGEGGAGRISVGERGGDGGDGAVVG